MIPPLGWNHLGDFMELPEKKLEALHMESMVLLGSCAALHQKLYDFVYMHSKLF
jgi:hypothetical protein